MEFVKRLGRSVAVGVKNYDWSKWKWKNLDKTKIGWGMRTMFHPYSTFETIRQSGKGSALFALVVFLAVFVTDTIAYSAEGFLFNTNRPEEFNIFLQFFQSELLILLWCVCNWCTTTLLDGEGKLGDIWLFSNYAMLPRVVFGIPLVVLSNVITLEEQMFLTFFQGALWLWCLVILGNGMIVFHQFTLKKVIGSSLLTLLVMACVVFIALLFVSISQQMLQFIQTLLRESINRV